VKIIELAKSFGVAPLAAVDQDAVLLFGHMIGSGALILWRPFRPAGLTDSP